MQNRLKKVNPKSQIEVYIKIIIFFPETVMSVIGWRYLLWPNPPPLSFLLWLLSVRLWPKALDMLSALRWPVSVHLWPITDVPPPPDSVRLWANMLELEPVLLCPLVEAISAIFFNFFFLGVFEGRISQSRKRLAIAREPRPPARGQALSPAGARSRLSSAKSNAFLPYRPSANAYYHSRGDRIVTALLDEILMTEKRQKQMLNSFLRASDFSSIIIIRCYYQIRKKIVKLYVPLNCIVFFHSLIYLSLKMLLTNW